MSHDRCSKLPRRPRILIVDDEEDILYVLKKRRSRFDCELMMAKSAEDAISMMEDMDHLEIVLSDLNMSGMNGIDLLRHVRSKYPHSIRVLCSGFLDLNVIHPLMQEGLIWRAFLKPLPLDRMEQLARSLLRQIQ